jgi:hypothetical protein
MSKQKKGPVVGTVTNFAKNVDRAKSRGSVSLTWGARDDGPGKRMAFLVLTRDDGSQQMIRSTEQEVETLIAELQTVKSWLRGNNYAGLGR